MKRKLLNSIALVSLIAVILIGGNSCNFSKVKGSKMDSIAGQVKHADWTKNLSIYEINVRQFSDEGTFVAIEKELPRLKALGTDILWIMPIHPIGALNRKGGLGSYYSVKDYLAVNPDYGTQIDFMRLVKKAHELGMYVIIDWVANHSAWDNALVTEHADWYVKDSATGNLVSPFDWTDVVKFNYNNKEMRRYMLGALKYWITNCDIDGYRCDVAGEVPIDFWMDARKSLDSLKPVFMLAEAESPELHKAFDMTYAWEFHHIMNKIHKKEASANDIEKYLLKNDSLYSSAAYRMNFITNHDENSWNGTEFERLGDGVKAFYVLTATVPGMPLIYTGQESALNKRLLFFEKDSIDWGNYPMADFYKTLLGLKKDNPALFNGKFGGNWLRIHTTDDANVFALLRTKDKNKVLSVVNLSDKPLDITLQGSDYAGDFTELFTGEKSDLKGETKLSLPAWGYSVYFK